MMKFMRSCCAICLVVCMLIGLCGNGIVAFAQQEKTTYYVSLGDSMTNGLGMLSGYDTHNSNGYMEVAYDAYPAQFSAWLAGYEGQISAGQTEYKGSKGTVKLTQLATSGMRAEDLNYILKYGGPNQLPGDKYMYEEVLKPGGRWNSAYAGGVEKVAAKFRSAITDADVISVALGNANFGVYLAGMITTATGMPGANDNDSDDYNLENALIGCDQERIDKVWSIYNMILPVLKSTLPAELAETLANRVGYVVVKYLTAYSAALDEIAALNPDARVIIIGIFNTMSGTDAYVTYNGQEHYVNLADIMDLAIGPINDYLAGLPAQKNQQPAYKDMTFYYAQADNITTLATTFQDVYTEDRDFFRGRFIHDVADTVFPLVEGDMPFADITLEDVNTYEAAYQKGIDHLADYAKDNYDKALASAVYLATEKTLVKHMDETPKMNMDEIMAYDSGSGIQDYFGDVMSGAMGTFRQNVSSGAASQQKNAAKAYLAAQKGVSMSSITSKMINQALADSAQKQKIDALAELWVTEDAFTAALESDERAYSLLNIYAQSMLASGMNQHPNFEGHDTITAAVQKAWLNGPLKNGYTYTYGTKQGSLYLALGDATAYGTAATGLSKELANATQYKVSFVNKTKKDQTAEDLLNNLSQYADEIKRADLITLSFSANNFTSFVVSQLKLILANKAPLPMDWDKQLGADKAALIKMLLKTISEPIVGAVGGGSLEGFGISLDLGLALSTAIESFVYSFLTHKVSYSKLVAEIRLLNPDAQIVTVGMYNPMKGVKVSMGDAPLDIGQYLQIMVDMSNSTAKKLAHVDPKCTYVDAPNVQTSAAPTTYEMVPFFMDLLMKGTVKYNPSKTAYTYIQQQMSAAVKAVPAESISVHYHEYYDWRVIQAATSTAEGLRQRDCVHCGHYEQRTIPVQTGPSQITSDKFAISVNTVSKIADGTTVAQLLQGLGEAEYIKVYKDNQEISGDKKIGTGMEIRLIVGGQTVQSLTAIVTGDTNGDGVITVTDMLAVKSHVLNKSKLSGVSFTAGDTNGDGNITITDFIQVKAQILGKSDVTPR